jgi:hypothetical protein
MRGGCAGVTTSGAGIVADESRRGYTTAEQSLWRNTLDHFDAIEVRLTATPAAHTTAYSTDVVLRYEYAWAVPDQETVTMRSDGRRPQPAVAVRRRRTARPTNNPATASPRTVAGSGTGTGVKFTYTAFVPLPISLSA